MPGTEYSKKYEELERTIAALEDQRATLGDDVVEIILDPMRRQLIQLEQAERELALGLEGERKLVTVMFVDFSGFTTLLEKLDPESVRELVNSCYNRLVPIISNYGGTVEKFIGDEVMVIFGAPITHENDPEYALRGALEIVAELTLFNADHDINIEVHIGINSGIVVAGRIGSEGQHQYGVMGDAVNIAKRLQGLAPAGGILISHETYRHVQGLFEFLPQEAIKLKGITKPVLTYLVNKAKPSVSRLVPKSVEGIKTTMVGRESEWKTLQRVFHAAVKDSKGHLVIVFGEAGVGKSRLLYEFEQWMKTLLEETCTFKGWAMEGTQTVPFSVIRRMFASRFEILESDSAATVLGKIRTGFSGILDQDQADLIGHLIGFDYPSSQAVLDALDSESFRKKALASFVRFFQIAAKQPTVIIMEDMHWADDSSFELIDLLIENLSDSPLMVICLARSSLFEKRPKWGKQHPENSFIKLKTLSLQQSKELIKEILKKVERIPIQLIELILERAEGNPYYIEELIKMLIEDGVIQITEEAWHVELEHLDEVNVPPTLTEVIQARLDCLPSAERSLLQRAAVVGHSFWDLAVAGLVGNEAVGHDKEEITSRLENIRRRELILRRENSAFLGTVEYQFKHALLHEVTYGTVMHKVRKHYHRQAAGWLENQAGDRLGEYLGLIASHYDLAGDKEKAASYLLRAGDRARLAYAHQEALEYYQRALIYLKEYGEHERAARTMMKIGLTFHTAFDYPRSRQAFAEGFGFWQQAQKVASALPLEPAPHPFRMARANPLTLDPTSAGDSFSGGVINQLFSGLVEGRLAMETMPDVAHSWELSDNGKKYIFHLRKDVRWSDGVPVTAADFEYAWKRVLDPALRSPNASLLFDIKGAKSYHEGGALDPGSIGIHVVDDHTLVVDLEGPSGYFLSLLAHYAAYPVPRHVVEEFGQAWTEMDHIVTNGAFLLETWNLGQSMALARNPTYHGHFSGNLQRVEIFFDVDWPSQMAMYENDELDFLSFGGTPEERDRGRRRHAEEYMSSPMLGSTYVGFDVSRPPFNDPLVRRAFASAIDKEKLADEVLRGYEFPAVGGFIPPGIPAHCQRIGPSFDPERARLLLARAGYPGGRGFPRVDAWTWPAIKGRADFLHTQWKEHLGIQVDWEVKEFPQFIAKIDQVPTHMIQTVWMPDYPDPDSVLRASPIRRRTKWRDDTYEGLVEKARRTLDQGERVELYRAADRILVEEQVVVIPLTYMWSHILVKPWMRKLPAMAINEWLWKDFIIKAH